MDRSGARLAWLVFVGLGQPVLTAASLMATAPGGPEPLEGAEAPRAMRQSVMSDRTYPLAHA